MSPNPPDRGFSRKKGDTHYPCEERTYYVLLPQDSQVSLFLLSLILMVP